MFRRGAPCEVCHLWACKCDLPEVPRIEDADCQTPDAEHPDERTAEHVEAETRTLMAAHSAIQARGFDTHKRRAYLHRQIDCLLDEWLKTDVGIELVAK